MKKFMALILIVLSVLAFADVQNISEVKPKPGQKGWEDYSGTPDDFFDYPFERAIYYNAEDFGLEYPIDFYGVQTYIWDGGVNYHYKIYDKDGITVLWESADSLSYENAWQVTYVDYNDIDSVFVPVTLTDDFFISFVPQADGTPTTIMDAGDGPLGCHSWYTNGAGGWGFMEDAFGAPINHSMLIEIYETSADDIFPPIVRDIYGTSAFMDTDMNITLRLTDQNPIETPIVGDYSLDGGTTWAQFNLDTLATAAKGELYVVGTIPAQVDSTSGIVRFNLADTLLNAGVSDEYEINWSKDNPILSEGFEGPFTPAGWSLATVGAGWIQFKKDPTFNNVRTGDYCASHYYDDVPNDDWLISPVLNIPATGFAKFSFWQVGVYTDYLEYHEVAVTTDGGSTWTPIYIDDQPAPNSDITTEHQKEIFLLHAYAGQSIQIGWHYTGQYLDQWCIDDVEVVYDYQGPTVADIVGNEALRDSVGVGAFLNNDLDIALTLNDVTGVQSVIGHYSYDGGSTYTDLTFTAAKEGDEVWTAAIPAESAPIAGIIYFDMVDTGGNTSASADYDFEFVGDGDKPIFKYVTGTSAFVNDPMNLTIVFSDESAITSCSGAYSKDGWVTQYDFELTPSKIHEYTYVGIIPAETDHVLDGEVIFNIGDEAGNFTQTDPELVQWKYGQQEYFQDFETDYSDWYFGGNWGVVEEGEYTSDTHALTESPGGNYGPNESSFATLSTALDWSTYKGANMSFWCKYDIEAGFDYMYFQVTPDNGMNWTTLKVWDGEGIDWHEEKVSLDAFVGSSQFNFRFLFVSDGGYETKGMYIDDISIVTYDVDYAAPLPVYASYEPEVYEGTFDAFTNNVDILEVTGIDAVEIVWSVDGTPQPNIVATLVSENQWEFTIPQQDPGAVIEYQFWTRDNSPLANEALNETVYTIISGNHMIYDGNEVSYYNTTENGDAKAVRITVGASDATTTYGAPLSYLLFQNYADNTHQSVPMTVRIWQDDGTGQPGTEIIAPFDVTPPANDYNRDWWTMIDMRSYDLTVYGDFWVGYSAGAGTVYGTQEDTGETFGTPYNRSYDGASNGDGTWTWTQYTGTNYMLRAVLGEASGIEEGNMPLTTALEQNYPNPFNPVTTINFTIAEEAKVSLVVYDVMGREVARLVDGNLAKGIHNVNFDAASLVSGVYYYKLKAGNVNQTKKMMLIK